MLEWICRRLDGDASGADTAIGVVPAPDDLDLDGLDVSADDVAAALAVDDDAWKRRAPRHPRVLRRVRRPHADASSLEQLDALEARLA